VLEVMDAFTEILSAESVAEVLAGVLERLAESNAVSSETATVEEPAPSIFDAVAPPSITIRMYLRRIVEYVKCSGESIVMALVYIDRLIERRAFAVTALNVHRLLITSILLAAKCFDDEYYSNGFFAQVGGFFAQVGGAFLPKFAQPRCWFERFFFCVVSSLTQLIW
jgi:hypothetical protein